MRLPSQLNMQFFTLKKQLADKKKYFHLRGYFWFFCGVILGFFFFISFLYISYKKTYEQVIFPGVYISGADFGGKTLQESVAYFDHKNSDIQRSVLVFQVQNQSATVSAKEIQFGYTAKLLADQAYSIGRSGNFFSDVSLLLQAYMHGIYLPPSYSYDQEKLEKLLEPLRKNVYIAPVEAKFTFAEGKVQEFAQSSDGQEVDIDELKNVLTARTLSIVSSSKPQTFTIPVPLKVLHPDQTTEEVNNMGIKELLAAGTSLFVGSIPNRTYNIALAASRLDGILIKPGEIFSFNKALGDVSTLTGYKQAYIIQNGRTVLGDGGGVCQVSTTFFRALLHAGLPIVERNPHAYRVGYYEQDAGPGLDAAIYVPTVDLKFKNDTKHYILVQTIIDPDSGRLTFELYGTKDGREVVLSEPVITSVTSSPEPLYIDDPTLPKGEVKQVDYAVSGASVYFTRTVTQYGKVILSDTFSSVYRPWQAVYMRGTKEN